MWVARFTVRDDEDIYSPLCVKHHVDMFAYPYSHFEKGGHIHLLVGAVLGGSEAAKDAFVQSIRKDKRVKGVERHHDFIFIHAAHPASREARAEIKIFYNPEFVRVKPVRVSSDGWEYWEVASLDRDQLNHLLQAAKRYYHGTLLSMRRETLHGVASLEIAPQLSPKQLDAIRSAFKEGYYTYPRSLTIPDLAKLSKKSYATFQEHLRKAENKLVAYFLKYR